MPVNLDHPALTVGVRVWQILWAVILLASSAAVLGITGASDLHAVNFGVFLGIFCTAVAILYIVATKRPGTKIHDILPGAVDGALSSLLVIFCLAAACGIGNGLTATCRLVSNVLEWVRALGVGVGGGGAAEAMCATAQLALASAIILLFSFIVTAVFGFMGMWQGKGLVKLGGGSGAPAPKSLQMPAAGGDAADKA